MVMQNRASMTRQQDNEIDTVIGEGATARGTLEIIKNRYLQDPASFLELIETYKHRVIDRLRKSRNADPIQPDPNFGH